MFAITSISSFFLIPSAFALSPPDSLWELYVSSIPSRHEASFRALKCLGRLVILDLPDQPFNVRSKEVGSPMRPSLLRPPSPRRIRTLHKIRTFVEAQQQEKKTKDLFGINGMNRLLQNCHAGLKQAQKMFSVGPICIQIQAQTLDENTEFRKIANLMHRNDGAD
ncbi:hypothetical protein K438DRAFT_1758108 [Mycena galopus ATCC 62051]|nr:hypothetical protein K438DRAFT_1758108 [Mycena galopus ATCC 62051]